MLSSDNPPYSVARHPAGKNDSMLAVLPDIASDPKPSLALAADVANAKRFAENAHSKSTVNSYRRDRWCADRDLVPFPASPEVVAAYISHLAARGLRRNHRTASQQTAPGAPHTKV